VTDPVRDKVLVQALTDIPETGFSDATLAAAAMRTNVTKRELNDAFPQGAASLVEAFSYWADAEMMERMGDGPSEHLSARVKHAVRTRIEVLMPHREAARQAAGFLAAPQHASLGAKLLMRSVNAMWRAAGDQSTDFSYYSKRAVLSGVYASTFAYWFTDSSEGNAATWAFLDHRMNDVKRFEKFRGAVEGAVAKLPDPFGILAGLRGKR
jgi:ubiquinone biosynthesis protein COQ9